MPLSNKGIDRDNFVDNFSMLSLRLKLIIDFVRFISNYSDYSI